VLAHTISREAWIGWSGPLADQSLRAALSDFPGLIDLWVDEDKCFAFAQYDTFSNCGLLLEHNTLTAGDVVLKVRPRKPRESIFIRELPWKTGPQELFDLAAQFGECTYAHVSYRDGRSQGYGFLGYAEPAQLEAAFIGLSGMEVDGRTLQTDRADGRKQTNSREVSKDHPTTQAPASLPCLAPGRYGNAPEGGPDPLVVYTCESPAEEVVTEEARPTCPLRYREAPEMPFIRRKGSRRRKG